MASGIPVYSRFLRFWAIVFKALGGFPYSWDGRDSKNLFPGLKPRIGLRVWSYLIISFNLANVIFHASISLLNAWSVLAASSLTSSTLRKILRGIEVLVILILQLHLWLKKGDLQCLFSHLDMCSPGSSMREWAITHDKGYVVTILLHVSYIVSVAVGILLGSTTISFMSLSSVAFYAAYSAMTSVYTLSLYMIGKFLYLVLTDSFETFNAKIKISDSMYGTRRAKQVNILFEVEPRTKASVAPADHTASSESHVGLGSLLEGPREAQVPGESEANAMRELSRKVVHVHECQLLINRYFGLPSLVITSLSVTWIIHDTYSLIQDTDNTSASWELLLYILYSISVLVILCCVGEEARGKVSLILVNEVILCQGSVEESCIPDERKNIHVICNQFGLII